MAFGEAARVTSWTSVPLNAQRRLRITKGRPKAAQLARVPLRYLVLILAHLLDGDPVLSFGRNIKSLGRYLYGFLCIGSLNRAEMFGTLADNIDAPAGHLTEHLACQTWLCRLLFPVRARSALYPLIEQTLA